MWQWAVEKGIEVFGNCYISADDDCILKPAAKIGAIPIKRPPELLEAPNIPIFQHAWQFMGNPDVIVFIQTCSPTLDIRYLKMAKAIMENGCGELMSVHPMAASDDYHAQHWHIYGSIWAMTSQRLLNYPDPYRPQPEVLLVDPSVDIHNLKDFKEAEKQWL